jgi:N-hydroxyarylamine O-acetyltransferase
MNNIDQKSPKLAAYLERIGFYGTARPDLETLRELHGYWRFSERAHGEPFSFDFLIGTADETRFAEKCSVLQTSLDSPFVQNLVVQRRTGDTHLSLRGRVLTTLRKTGEEKIKLASVDEFVAALRDRFDLDVPEAAALWPAICARHDALFKDSES